MDTADSRVAVKLLPSLADIAFLMPIALLFGRMGGLTVLLGDGDTGWHIRTGEWILAHHAVPYRDLFSYSKPDSIWYAWEWLADVVFAGLNKAGGLAAISLFAVLLIAGTITLVFRLARRKSNAVVAIAVTVLAMAGSSIHWLARPHLFTLLFAVIFLNGLYHVREGQSRVAGIPWLVLLPVLTVLWSNLHGGFLVGVLLIAVFGAGELLRVLLAAGEEGRAAGFERAGKYFLSALACLVASLLNPYTYHLHVHVWQYLRDPYLGERIMEFLSVSFHHPIAIFFESMLAGGVLAAAWCARRGSFTEPLLFLLWAHLALLSARNIPIFMIVVAPMVAAVADAGLRQSAGGAGGGVAAAGGGVVQPHRAGNLPDRRPWALAPGQPGGRGAAGGADVCAPSAQAVPGRIRSEAVSRRRRKRAGAISPGAGLHLRSMGRLSDLPPVSTVPRVRGRAQRFLRGRFRDQAARTSQCELRLGPDIGPVRSGYGFNAPQLAAHRHLERVVPVAGGL